MQRPTAFYPEAPKLAFFTKPRNHVTSVSLHGGNSATNNPSPPPVFNDKKEAPLNALGYAEYLKAHREWLAEIETVDQHLHDQAIKRRFFENKKEVSMLQNIGAGDPLYRRINLTGYTTGTVGGTETPAQIKVSSKAKKATAPDLSTKPHEAEKRDKKKKLRDARAKAQAEVLQARINLVSKTSAVAVEEKLQKVQELKDLRPLHKLEEVAAKSAATRSKLIKFGSTDLTTNVDVSDGWKVVTRNKGAMIKQSEILQTVQESAGTKQVLTFVDPALSTRVPLMSAVRQPTVVGANKQ